MSLRQLEHLHEVDKRQANHPSPIWQVSNLSAIAEDVRSLWNVGSIFRSSDGAGVGHLFLCGITGPPPRKEIAKVSLGAEDTVPWTYHATALEVLDELRAKGIFILGLEYTKQFALSSVPDSNDLRETLSAGKIRFPACLIVGNEVTGVSAECLTKCDLICHLPMRGMKESLNVAVAFGIAVYMLEEQVAASAQSSENTQAIATME